MGNFMSCRAVFGQSRVIAFLLLALLPQTVLGEVKADQRVYAEDSLETKPTLFVILGKYNTLPEYPTQPFVGISFEVQWTANGASMPANLTAFKPGCIYRSAQQYSCEALTNWFRDPPRYGGRVGVKSLDPHGFYIPNLDFDTEYCFRFKPGGSSWTQWSCAGTGPAPALPPAPARPRLTMIAESTETRVANAAHPFALYVEWERLPNEALVAGYGVEMRNSDGFFFDAPGYGDKPGSATYHKTIELPGYDPDAVHAIRVCAFNISGKSCSPMAKTPGRAWAEKSRPRAAELAGLGSSDAYLDMNSETTVRVAPRPNQLGRVPLSTSAVESPKSVCDLAKSARARNSPAAPGLERQCSAFLQSAPSPQRLAELEDLAAKGALIADADPSVSDARQVDPSASFQRGFDVASGLFGDPALGSAGNSAMGPGSLAYRAALDTGGQLGFDAGVAFHLARDYRP